MLSKLAPMPSSRRTPALLRCSVRGYPSFLSLFIAFLLVLPFSATVATVGPSVQEVIEFTRIIQPLNHDDETLQTQVSPDGEQLFIVTRKASVATDRNRFEILLMDMSPRRLESMAGAKAAPPVPPKPTPFVLLAVESGHDRYDGDPSLREARWVGNRTIVFRARMNDEPHQVYQVDVLTRQVRQLTVAPLGVVAFEVSDDLRQVAYVSQVPNPALEPGTRAIIAGSKSFWSIHAAADNLDGQVKRYQFYLAQAGTRMPVRPLGEPFARGGGTMPRASFSPDGRWILLPKFQPARQRAWSELYPQIAELTQSFGPSLELDPLGYFSRPSGYVPRQMMQYRISDGQERPVLDAPDDAGPGNQQRIDRIWQNGGSSVVIAGIYLPPGKERDGQEADKAAGPGSHIIEYWPASGAWTRIAALKHRLQGAQAMRGENGQDGGFMVMDGEQRRIFGRGPDGRWREAAGEALDGLRSAGTRTRIELGPAQAERSRGAGETAPRKNPPAGGTAREAWRLQVRQALNQPPDVVAIGPKGREVRLTVLNPQFAADQWGTMQEYSWTDAKGRRWDGGLMVPADYQPGVRYPLVIQSYGFDPKRFYRDGSNIYDGFTSGFAGRAFLREGLLVLALPWRASTGAPPDEHGSIAAFAEGVRGAIDSLVAQGIVDRDRIGILGWSATGVRVQNLITFTDAPIRAATVLDGDANTLYSMTITYAFTDSTQKIKEEANQGGPFGESRERWIRNDPSLHTDCIRAALRIESYGAYAKNNSDIYALLRRQYRPVEMLKFPEGAHALSRPSERMVSLQGNVDWYRFWLKGERRQALLVPGETADTLQDQYARWEQMQAMKAEADAKPRCVRAPSAR